MHQIEYEMSSETWKIAVIILKILQKNATYLTLKGDIWHAYFMI